MQPWEIIAMALIKYGPSVARAIIENFQRQTIALEDWEKVFAIADRPYSYYTGTNPGPI